MNSHLIPVSIKMHHLFFTQETGKNVLRQTDQHLWHSFYITVEKGFMMALEFKEHLEVVTPKGDGYIWYMIDYGPQSDTLYTIILKESGECWQMSHKDFRVKANVSLGIKEEYQKLKKDVQLNGDVFK